MRWYARNATRPMLSSALSKSSVRTLTSSLRHSSTSADCSSELWPRSLPLGPNGNKCCTKCNTCRNTCYVLLLSYILTVFHLLIYPPLQFLSCELRWAQPSSPATVNLPVLFAELLRKLLLHRPQFRNPQITRSEIFIARSRIDFETTERRAQYISINCNEIQ